MQKPTTWTSGYVLFFTITFLIAITWTQDRKQASLGVSVSVEKYFKSTMLSCLMFVMVIEISESKQENELHIFLVRWYLVITENLLFFTISIINTLRILIVHWVPSNLKELRETRGTGHWSIPSAACQSPSWKSKKQCNFTFFPSSNTEHYFFIILVLLDPAEMELTFFIAAHMVLCLGFLTKRVLITHQYFGYCWTMLRWCQVVLSSPLIPVLTAGSRLGKKFRGDTTGAVDHWPKG